jgi:hypothetical protein
VFWGYVRQPSGALAPEFMFLNDRVNGKSYAALRKKMQITKLTINIFPEIWGLVPFALSI